MKSKETLALIDYINVLEKALMRAIRESYTHLCPESHQKLFNYYVDTTREDLKL